MAGLPSANPFRAKDAKNRKDAKEEMQDKIFEAFLKRQTKRAWRSLDRAHLLELYPMGGDPPDRYVASVSMQGLMRSQNGDVVEADHFEVGIWFPSDYLRRAEPFQVLTWVVRLTCSTQISATKAPFICVGKLKPNTALADILISASRLSPTTR